MKNTHVTLYGLLLLFGSAFLLPDDSCAQEAGDWKLSIEPYLMLTSIDGTAGIGRVAGKQVNVQFQDILKNLEFAGMIHAEAHHSSNWGLLIDYGFMNLGADIAGPLGGVINAGAKQGVLELLVARKINFANYDVELLGGFRWWTNKVNLTLNPAILPGSISASTNESWLDPVIGARLTIPLSDQLTFVMRGDLGGFSVGSDFTTEIAGGIHYRFTKMFSLDAQYKALWVDYSSGTAGQPGYFAYKTVTHGPVLGLIIDF
ncbi:MAG: hypothetical protein ACE5DZ_08045 [Mariprofundus sp.]